MKHRLRARVAFTVTGICLVAISVALAACMWFHERATNTAPTPGVSPAEAAADSDGFPEVDWAYWQGINTDVIGWVTVEGTPINYPIVQAPTTDPTYYLYHDVYRDYNVYGCPYLDAECATDGLFGSQNAVVFGHHMDDGSMFAAFADFANEAYAAEHGRILVQTPTEKRIYEPQAASIVPGWEAAKRTTFNSPEDFDTYIAERFEAAAWGTQNATSPMPNIITLCTCSYNYWSYNERTLVFATQVKDSTHAAG